MSRVPLFPQRVQAGELPLAELAKEFQVAAHLPDVSGLPDGLTAKDFSDRFGSIGDARFAAMLTEIRRRIAELPDDGEIKGEKDRRSKEE